MTVKLLDYEDNAIEADVGDINDIVRMSIRVLSGDEVLTVIRKDTTVETFDSSDCRFMSFFDGEYDIYDVHTGVNYFNNEAFMNRQSSYWV